MGYSETCKAKGIKLALTWCQSRYWKKKVAGKQLYFKTANTSAGYEAALAQWAKSQEIPEPPDPKEDRPFLRRICDWYDEHGDPEDRANRIRIFLDAKYQSERQPDGSYFHHFGSSEAADRHVTAPAGKILAVTLGESFARDNWQTVVCGMSASKSREKKGDYHPGRD